MTENLEDVRRTFAEAEDIPAPEPFEGGDDGHVPPPNNRAPRDGADEPDEGKASEGALLPLNDTGNGSRFALYCGDQALFVPRVGWHVWDKRRWKLDPDGIAVRRHAQQIQHHIIDEIQHLELEGWQLQQLEREVPVRQRLAQLRQIEDADRSAEVSKEIEDLDQEMKWIAKIRDRRSGMKADHRNFSKTTGNKGRIDAMLTEATTSLSRDIEDLDSDPLTVNVENGLLRFTVVGGGSEGFAKTADVKIEEHAQEVPISGGNATQVITKLMPVEYDPKATCETFEKFLARVQPDKEMRDFLQRWWGLSMSALTVQKFLFQYGSGANGKSVLSDLMGRLLGDYSTSVKIESLTGRNRRGGGDATPDLMPLVGARSARASEPEEGERLQEGMIKEMTGGEKMLVRNLHADFIEVRPHFKLTISGNHKPDIRGTDDGIWRRVLLVPFDVQIPEGQRDDKLIDKLWDERSGILNWLIEGLLDYLEGGLREPDKVIDATADYRADSDPIKSFLQECCQVSGDNCDFLPARSLIDGFQLWQDLRGEGTWGNRSVSLKLKDRAGKYRDGNTGKTFIVGKVSVTGYRGIRFTDEFRDTLDRAPRNANGRPVAFTSSHGSSGREDPDE